MLCPRCASHLPDEMDRCIQCGTLAIPPTPLPALCAACGDPCNSEFCDSCEKALGGAMQVRLKRTSAPAATAPPTPAPAETFSSSAIEVQSASPLPSPPYADFVVVVLAFLLCLSVLAFAVADDIARRHFYFAPLILFCALTALMLAVWPMHSTYGALMRAEITGSADRDLPHARAKLRSRSLFFSAAFAILAALVGYLIGASGAATEKLIADFRKFNELGDRISEMRSAAEGTLASEFAMYGKLSGPVHQFRGIAKEIRTELTSYDERYPDSHDKTKQWMDAMDAAVHRSELIDKEIEVAGRIEKLPQDTWESTWQSEMQPLLDEEEAIGPSDD